MAVTKRTIFNFFGGYYFCESTDEKPTNVKVNDRILELDTAREYFWDGTTWVLCGSVVYYPISATITNGTANVTIAADTDYVLPSSITVSGASYTYDSTTGAIALSSPTGAVSISAVCEVPSSYPVKGDIINIDMNGDGTDEQYLVLKNVGGSIVECLSRIGRGNRFAFSGNIYEDGPLDVDMNTTYYDTLSGEAKLAIVDKTFYQEEWAMGTVGTVVYTGVRTSDGNSYQLSLVNSNYGNLLTRHIYVSSISDILDFLGTTTEMTAANTTLRSENLTVFRDDGRPTMLLSSKRNNSSDIFIVSTPSTTSQSRITDQPATSFIGYSAFPAFQIDLDKITWSPAG